MDLASLRLAAELKGHLLTGPEPGHALLLLERPASHGAPTLLVFARDPADLAEPLAAIATAQSEGVTLSLCAVLPTPATDLAAALAFHRRRIGSLLGALHAGLAWLGDRPMLPKRLPGRIRSPRPAPLSETPLRPLERQELRAFLPDWPEEAWSRAFLRPDWTPVEGGFEAHLWPDVPMPEGAERLAPPLVLPSVTPFSEALRSALRAVHGRPVPWLPLPADPADLRALAPLTPDLAGFRGPREAWLRALRALAALPAPPHFCARC